MQLNPVVEDIFNMMKDNNGHLYALKDSAPVQMIILLTLYASQLVGVLPSLHS